MIEVLVPRATVATAGEWAIPGDPSGLADLAGRLRVLGQGLATAAAELRAAHGHVGAWHGEGAVAFEAAMAAQHPRYTEAAGAFSVAAGLVEAFSGALAEAQSRARAAAALYDQGQQESAAWAAARATPVPPALGLSLIGGVQGGPHLSDLASLGPDYGVEKMAQARSQLTAAREALAGAGAQMAAGLAGASAGAPSRPRYWAQVARRGRAQLGDDIAFGAGVATGVAGMAKAALSLGRFVWSVSPDRLILDPRGWLGTVERDRDHVGAIASFAAGHPASFAKDVGESLVDRKLWSHDPAKALGELVPAVALTVLSGGAVATARAGEGTEALVGAGALRPASSALSGELLRRQLLAKHLYGTYFTEDGELRPEVIPRSVPILRATRLGNELLKGQLASDGSELADWWKHSVAVPNGPSGGFEIHFYRNAATGQLHYGLDYKSKLSDKGQPR